jgi:hypothetical protein
LEHTIQRKSDIGKRKKDGMLHEDVCAQTLISRSKAENLYSLNKV